MEQNFGKEKREERKQSLKKIKPFTEWIQRTNLVGQTKYSSINFSAWVFASTFAQFNFVFFPCRFLTVIKLNSKI